VEQSLEKIQELLSMFDHRDVVRDQCNQEILTSLKPTLLTAFVELLDVDWKNVVWEDMFLRDNTVVVVATVSYDPVVNRSELLRSIPVEDQSTDITEIERTVQFGVPLELVFTSTVEIKNWFAEFLESESSELPTVRSPSPEEVFNTTDLTKDQINQALYFGSLTQGIKQ
jgi:hypothetical protein